MPAQYIEANQTIHMRPSRAQVAQVFDHHVLIQNALWPEGHFLHLSPLAGQRFVEADHFCCRAAKSQLVRHTPVNRGIHRTRIYQESQVAKAIYAARRHNQVAVIDINRHLVAGQLASRLARGLAPGSK